MVSATCQKIWFQAWGVDAVKMFVEDSLFRNLDAQENDFPPVFTDYAPEMRVYKRLCQWPFMGTPKPHFLSEGFPPNIFFP